MIHSIYKKLFLLNLANTPQYSFLKASLGVEQIILASLYVFWWMIVFKDFKAL